MSKYYLCIHFSILRSSVPQKNKAKFSSKIKNNLAQFSHFEDQVTKTQRAKMFGDIFYWWLGGAHPWAPFFLHLFHLCFPRFLSSLALIPRVSKQSEIKALNRRVCCMSEQYWQVRVLRAGQKKTWNGGTNTVISSWTAFLHPIWLPNIMTQTWHQAYIYIELVMWSLTS